MNSTEALNIIALVAVPILAVVVGQCLQDRAEKRRDKMRVFKTLMTARVGWTRESVEAMNIIDVVFVDDKKVREAWKDYYDKLCIINPDTYQQGKIEQAKLKLLEAMAKALGYKDKITWETIQNPYMPIGQLKQMQDQETYSQELLTALGRFNRIASNTPNGAAGQSDEHRS